METVTEILVDISGSMKNKMIVTKQALLNDILPELDSDRIGIKTFSTVGNPKQLSVNPILPLSKTDKEVIKQKIQSISCSNGGTPIAATIKASVKSLAEYIANDKVIILVTDGAETEGGDYVLEAKKATEEGIKCKIHVIRIDLKEEDKLKAKEIASITGGTPNFITLPNSSYNQRKIRTNLTGFYQAVRKGPQTQIATSTPINQNAPSFTQVPEAQPKTEEKKEETKPDQDTKIDENLNPTLELIVEQIKELRKELAELKKERKQIPEVDEDPIENEKIRKVSEEFLFKILKKKYPDRVKWLNQNGESNEDHDFEILDLDGATVEYYIECKGTPKNKPTFYVTKNEWRLFLNHTKNYQIYFVKNSFGNPNYIFIDNVLDWLLKGKIVPYLLERDIIKEERVVLTINNVTFND